MRPILWCLVSLVAAPAAAGETCKYVDAEGRITFANVPVKNARRVMCFDPVPQYKPAPKPNSPGKPDPSGAASTAKVDTETQRRRDTDRRRILEKELADEQRLLEDALRAAQQAGVAGKDSATGNVVESARSALEAVARHERNVEAIRRELSATK